MEELFELTIEQQFELRRIQDSAGQIPAETLQEFLVSLTRQLMVKDNVIKHLLKKV